MRWLCLFLLLIVGCESKPFAGRCTIEKVDGVVTSVKIAFPNPKGSQEITYNCNTREDLDRLISGLDSILLDLKAAKEQMKVIEPKEK